MPQAKEACRGMTGYEHMDKSIMLLSQPVVNGIGCSRAVADLL